MTEQEIIHKLRTDPKARKTFLRNLRKRYRAKGGSQPAMAWALDFLGAAIWNELFAYKGSSHPIKLISLTRRHAYNIARAARAYRR